MRDLINNIDLKRAISPAAAVADNTPFVSQILDRMGAESVALAIILGAIADADATFAVTLDHGDVANLSDAAAVPADQMNGTLTLAGFDFNADNLIRKLGYLGGKRYVRATITPSNNAGNVFLSAVWILGKNNMRPTANPPV
ncbi:hypothetical protein Rleg9DRAFT_1703 [Rhizobium leguminosarum bv. trifolii WSM597]|uniref:Uncharacterized protein n=1 Tax=Rhizobium leguminosarum bv. trifolii WSM597 TaxID=754764 RepID=I9N4S6_RHILT|nr:hypothetical protein [Rhizobium leguminosarum]EJB02889.1 hypothetical protein Rleg9DRAFT_1703 [Rhizobium leguminosarum bv. trifolii WSM597]